MAGLDLLELLARIYSRLEVSSSERLLDTAEMAPIRVTQISNMANYTKIRYDRVASFTGKAPIGTRLQNL